MFDSWERRLAALLGVLWLSYAYWLGPPSLVFKTLVFLAFPLVFIWLPNEIGAASSVWNRSREQVPGIVLTLFGWFLLLVTPIVTYCLKMRMELFQELRQH